jgi:hypothetical protein
MKMERNGVRVWAIGQAIAARELLRTLADPKRGKDGLFPELVLFDCHACHHPMSDKKWQPRTGAGPGRIRLNDANLLMVRNIVKTINPSQSAALNAQILLVHKAVSGEPDSVGTDPLQQARKLAAMLDEQVKRFESAAFSPTQMQAILGNLIDEGLANGYSDYAGAEQAYMAVSSVSSFLQKQGATINTSQVNATLASMRKSLVNDEKFDPARFKADLLKLKNLTSHIKVGEKG